MVPATSAVAITGTAALKFVRVMVEIISPQVRYIQIYRPPSLSTRYVIIGNGVAGVTAAMTLRQRDRKAAITLIGGESDYFFSRTALMYAYMDRMTLRDLEPFERSVWDKQAIRRMRAWVKDVDAGRAAVTLDTGESIPYDRLLLAIGARPNRPAWKGLD